MSPRQTLLASMVALSGVASASAHAETIPIVMDKLVYVPAEITAKIGDTVEWINNDILVHTATATNGDWNVVIAPKKMEPLVLKKAGTIDYFCKYHPNMKGRIAVAPK